MLKFISFLWLKLQNSNWRANLLKFFFLQMNFSPMRALKSITGHVIFKLCCNQIYQMKTTFFKYLIRIKLNIHICLCCLSNDKPAHQIVSRLQKLRIQNVFYMKPSLFIFIYLCTVKYQFGCGISKMVGPKKQAFCPGSNMFKGNFDTNYFQPLMIFSSLQKSEFLMLIVLFLHYFWCQI